jgi:adenylosuccinate lyase
MPKINFADYTQSLTLELKKMEQELQTLQEKMMNPQFALELKKKSMLKEEGQKLINENYKPQKLNIDFSLKQKSISTQDIIACLENIYKI